MILVVKSKMVSSYVMSDICLISFSSLLTVSSGFALSALAVLFVSFEYKQLHFIFSQVSFIPKSDYQSHQSSRLRWILKIHVILIFLFPQLKYMV